MSLRIKLLLLIRFMKYFTSLVSIHIEENYSRNNKSNFLCFLLACCESLLIIIYRFILSNSIKEVIVTISHLKLPQPKETCLSYLPTTNI
jgi:hypothetical protein